MKKALLILPILLLFGCEGTNTEIKPEAPSPKPPVTIPTSPQKTLEGSLDSPWKKEGTSIVIDAFSGNSIDWNKMAVDKKMVGVIHRSSTGLRTDTSYLSRKKIALEKGYLWGAYHLGARGNTIKQADLFLSLANDKDTMMFLDLEDFGNAGMMSLDEAVTFMNYVYEKTGKVLSVYANHSVAVSLNSKLKSNALFKNSKFWYARFKAKVSDFPKGVWDNYFLWQFSSEINCSKTGSCLYNVPGTLSDMDVNVFYGTPNELKAAWNNEAK